MGRTQGRQQSVQAWHSLWEAQTIFDDPLYIDFYDPDHSKEEERYLRIGASNRGRLLLVAYTERGNSFALLVLEKSLEPSEKLMKKDNPDLEDDLRPEYDLKRLSVRKLGTGRNSFSGTVIRLEPDVAEMFPSADAVNEALRFLIKVTQERQSSDPTQPTKPVEAD